VSLYDDVAREALHDWLDERDALRADERPDPSEYEDEPRDEDEEAREEEWLDSLPPGVPREYGEQLVALSKAALTPWLPEARGD
jgi:hypothetical protein